MSPAVRCGAATPATVRPGTGPCTRSRRTPRRSTPTSSAPPRATKPCAGATRIGGGMARLIYSAIASLDGYVADEDGRFDWSMPDEEVHHFVNDLERPI